jgi:hypothetical protein
VVAAVLERELVVLAARAVGLVVARAPEQVPVSERAAMEAVSEGARVPGLAVAPAAGRALVAAPEPGAERVREPEAPEPAAVLAPAAGRVLVAAPEPGAEPVLDRGAAPERVVVRAAALARASAAGPEPVAEAAPEAVRAAVWAMGRARVAEPAGPLAGPVAPVVRASEPAREGAPARAQAVERASGPERAREAPAAMGRVRVSGSPLRRSGRCG